MKQLKRHFGAVSPATLRSAHIAAYRDARLKAGLAGATVVKEINSLSHLLDVAIKDWGIALHANPMEVAAISGHKTLQMLKRYTHLRAAELVLKIG